MLPRFKKLTSLSIRIQLTSPYPATRVSATCSRMVLGWCVSISIFRLKNLLVPSFLEVRRDIWVRCWYQSSVLVEVYFISSSSEDVICHQFYVFWSFGSPRGFSYFSSFFFCWYTALLFCTCVGVPSLWNWFSGRYDSSVH